MSYFIKAIIFDLDGVIVNSNPAIEAFWKSWTDKEGVELTESLIRQWIHGRKVGDTLSGLFGHVSEATKNEIRQSAYEFDISMNPGAINGVTSFIQSVNRLQLPAGIVTSSHHARMLQMLEKLGIADQFTHFVTAHDVSKGKPHPEPYVKMSEVMNIPPADCLVFEDAISGIQSAAAAGMHAIGIGNAAARDELAEYGAKDVIPDFTGIHIHQRTFTTVNGIVFSV